MLILRRESFLFCSPPLQQREGGATGPYAVQKVVTVFVRAVAVVVCESQNPPGELHHGGSPEEI